MADGKAAGNQLLNDSLRRWSTPARWSTGEALGKAVDKADLARRFPRAPAGS